MTMLVDRRKDNYDELLVLARDSRLSRARTNRWTTGMIVGAMAATGAYVATTSQQVEALRETTAGAEEKFVSLKVEYEAVLAERNSLMIQLDVIVRQQDLLVDVGPMLNLSNSITELARRLGGEPPTDGETVVTHFATSNIVWMVDGSRRFPVIDGDIVWVPEGNFWIRFTGKAPAAYKLYLHTTKPVGATPTGGELLVVEPPHKMLIKRGSSDCIEIRLHEKSLRPLFRAANYADIEITYFKSHETYECDAPSSEE